ncbi:MAG: 3-phosphoshikimate 1-carboxyvinyltransferase [Alphaproteobacteria bacterium]|nr:3-phosphoshikimate 1-carboxyvinyltransferase [Alphaproteobacteria bacterium]MCB9975327.1 3-phosphoshikimate 1-carboxyvinyltransferase [Rhodospirillales bacterium]
MSHSEYTRSCQSRCCGPLKGTVRVPGDKSVSHRALMFGALAQGETLIGGLLEGEDVLNTAEALRHMGAKIANGSDGLWRVYGVGVGKLTEPACVLDMGNSGTSTRLLLGLVAGQNFAATFTGDASLVKRPMRRVMVPLGQMGAQFLGRTGDRLPLTVRGADGATAVTYELPVASAQVKSAVLLAALNTKGRTTVIENKPTRDHTENMLRHFGVDVVIEPTESGGEAISIEGPVTLKPCAVDVPGDPSSAAFPVVAGTLIKGSEVTLSNVLLNPRRTGLYETLQEMGADIRFEHVRIESGERVGTIVVRGSGVLKGVRVPAERVPSMIDEFPVLAVVAACAEGTTRMSGLEELRVKESDRLLMIAKGLEACGVDLEMGEDSLTIHGTGKPPKGGALIETALDHRIAMSFLVLGCVAKEVVEIDDASPIRTSFPGFIDLMNDLGAQIDTGSSF